MTSTRGHRTFDHTADIGLEIWGDTFIAIFEEAGKALFSVILESKEVLPKNIFEIELKAESGEELFLKWLKELLYIFETKKIVFSEFNILTLAPEIKDAGGWTLTAKALGEALNLDLHQLGKEVKAITRHQFEFNKTESGFRAQVILDI